MISTFYQWKIGTSFIIVILFQRYIYICRSTDKYVDSRDGNGRKKNLCQISDISSWDHASFLLLLRNSFLVFLQQSRVKRCSSVNVNCKMSVSDTMRGSGVTDAFKIKIWTKSTSMSPSQFLYYKGRSAGYSESYLSVFVWLLCKQALG